MIGDRDTDISCGQTAGTRTILILNQERNRENKNHESKPDFKAADLKEAVSIITQHI
jgi:phosphoglycolate phosphatase-like HAD superfamily hydrolase